MYYNLNPTRAIYTGGTSAPVCEIERNAAFLMHLRSIRKRNRKRASTVERAVILDVDLLGNNREPLGGAPLISIFKRERYGSGIYRAGRKTSGECRQRDSLSLSFSLCFGGPLAFGGYPGAAVRIAGDFQSSKYTSMPTFSSALMPRRDIDTTVVARADIPVAADATGQPSTRSSTLPTSFIPSRSFAVACPRAHRD